ncbi:MAG: hypothetical protein QNJ30_13500 [Kiloniellales bacterium]|nr:hypothetical protein [Kiloniellales bacterium]
MIWLPSFAGEDDPKILQNLFELDFVGLAIATWFSVMLAWAVMHTLGLIFVHVAFRNDLPFMRETDDAPSGTEIQDGRKPGNNIPRWLKRFRHPIFALLAVPIVFMCWKSTDELLTTFEKALAVCFGLLAGIAVLLLSFVVRKLYGMTVDWRMAAWRRVKTLAGHLLKHLFPERAVNWMKLETDKVAAMRTLRVGYESVLKGYETEHDDTFTRSRAWAFLFVTALIYFLGWDRLRPDQITELTEWVPAIAYLLILLMLLVWVLSGLSLFLDKYRVPLLFTLLGVASLNYMLSDTDHFYELSRKACPDPSQGAASYGPEQVFADWAKSRHPDRYPVVVAVAASGGGITAARWSSQVLVNLLSDDDLAERFGKSIILISAVSGSSVGTMYFVDAYSDQGPPKGEKLERVVEQASRSSLGAVGWGFVYPDFWRSFIDFFVPKHLDRGWALQERWAAGALHGSPTFLGWRGDIRNGWRPVLVLNATEVETGKRLAIAPIDVPTNTAVDTAWRASKLLHWGDDLQVATAARLSATFPYVTPISRPDLPDTCDENKYHAADGGYYDNFGILSAVEFLRGMFLELKHEPGDPKRIVKPRPRKVLLVQIRASNPEEEQEPDSNQSYLSILTGPLVTLLNVRTPSQVSRNDQIIEALKDRWAQENIILETATFQLDKESPLSWHLSEADKQDISDQWKSQRNQCALRKVKEVIGLARHKPVRLSDSGPDCAPYFQQALSTEPIKAR